MRTNVTFRHPAEFVRLSDDDGILAVSGTTWFVCLLQRVPDLQVDRDLCQEDWGVVAFVKRSQKQFWIGLSFWDEGQWLAHFHHGSFAWLQRFGASGNAELRGLLLDFHQVLESEPVVSEIRWYLESEIDKPNSNPSARPVDV